MNTATDSKTTFKFLDAKLFVTRTRANPQIPLANEAILKTDFARYNLTRVELKTFSFSAGPQSLSINQAVLGCIPKRLLFSMIANTLSRHHQYKSLQFSTFRALYIRDDCKW
jgi:hypothetical protein